MLLLCHNNNRLKDIIEMFIQTEDTPNPNTVKFLMPELLLEANSISLTRGSKELTAFPVAEHLFALEEIVGIFICNNFISVTKEANTSWESLKTLVLSKLLDLTSQKLPMVRKDLLDLASTNSSSQKSSSDASVDQSIVTQIKELIETRVRPAVAQDGGDIIYQDFRDGIVYLELHGACSGCPSSTITLKNGIENMLKHYIPEIQAVEAV